MNRKNLSVAAGLCGTAVFCYAAFRNVPAAELALVLKRADWRWMLVMFAINFMDLVIRALRWRLLLSRAADAKASLLFKLEAIGIAVNNVAFLRLGEFARAYLAGRELGIPVATALASVAVERALDVAALLALFNIAAFFLPGLVLPQVRLAAAAVLGGVIAVLFLLIIAEGYLEPEGAWEKRLRPWPKVHDLVSQLVSGAEALREPATAFKVFALSLGLWAMDAGAYWAAAYALGMERFIGYTRSVLILSWGGAGAALPAAPGAIGTFEAMVKTIVENLGASAGDALGFAVFTHMVGFSFVTIIGLAFLYQVGLTFAGLKDALAREDRRP